MRRRDCLSASAWLRVVTLQVLGIDSFSHVPSYFCSGRLPCTRSEEVSLGLPARPTSCITVACACLGSIGVSDAVAVLPWRFLLSSHDLGSD